MDIIIDMNDYDLEPSIHLDNEIYSIFFSPKGGQTLTLDMDKEVLLQIRDAINKFITEGK